MLRQRRPRDRKEATFLEHLEEFRQRLIRCVLYVAVGMGLTWAVRDQLMTIVRAPLERGAAMVEADFTFIIPQLAGGLVVSIQVAAVAGIILTSPLWLLEAWLFIEPALEDHERKWIVALLPAAVLLFLGGVAFCYWISPRAFAILMGFQLSMIGDQAAPILELKDYLTFFLRLLLVFGAMFELPLVIMFLSAVGLVKSAFLAQHWRIAIVIIAVVCAIVTPTPDAVTMAFLAGPMIGLYLLSIVLARFVEKGRSRREAEEAAARAAASPAPALAEPDPYAVQRDDTLPDEPEPDEASTEAHEAVVGEPDEEAVKEPASPDEPENQDPQ
jgi:sec-independent protein translocase protein TatC